MSKFESFVKGLTVTVEFIFLCGLAGSFEFGKLNTVGFILYTFSSLIIATHIYTNARKWNDSILNKIKYNERIDTYGTKI